MHKCMTNTPSPSKELENFLLLALSSFPTDVSLYLEAIWKKREMHTKEQVSDQFPQQQGCGTWEAKEVLMWDATTPSQSWNNGWAAAYSETVVNLLYSCYRIPVFNLSFLSQIPAFWSVSCHLWPINWFCHSFIRSTEISSFWKMQYQATAVKAHLCFDETSAKQQCVVQVHMERPVYKKLHVQQN